MATGHPFAHHLSFPLKPSGRSQDRNGLIHNPFADAEIAIDPALNILVLGDLIRVQARAVESRTARVRELAGFNAMKEGRARNT